MKPRVKEDPDDAVPKRKNLNSAQRYTVLQVKGREGGVGPSAWAPTHLDVGYHLGCRVQRARHPPYELLVLQLDLVRVVARLLNQRGQQQLGLVLRQPAVPGPGFRALGSRVAILGQGGGSTSRQVGVGRQAGRLAGDHRTSNTHSLPISPTTHLSPV